MHGRSPPRPRARHPFEPRPTPHTAPPLESCFSRRVRRAGAPTSFCKRPACGGEGGPADQQPSLEVGPCPGPGHPVLATVLVLGVRVSRKAALSERAAPRCWAGGLARRTGVSAAHVEARRKGLAAVLASPGGRTRACLAPFNYGAPTLAAAAPTPCQDAGGRAGRRAGAAGTRGANARKGAVCVG